MANSYKIEVKDVLTAAQTVAAALEKAEDGEEVFIFGPDREVLHLKKEGNQVMARHGSPKKETK